MTDLLPGSGSRELRSDAIPAAHPISLWPWWILIGAACAGLGALSLMLVPQSDDWFFASIGRDLGVLDGCRTLYLTWTGIWVCLGLVIGLPAWLGPFWAVRVESLIALIALGSAIHAVLRVLHPQVAHRSTILAAGGILALGVVTSEAQEGVFWGSTACNYSLGLAWALWLWVAAYDPAQPTIRRRILVLVLALILPGFSESIGVIAGGLLVLGCLLRPANRWLWAGALLGLALGSLPVILSPGNALRLHSSGGMRSFAEANWLVFSSLRSLLNGQTLLLWAVAVSLPTVFATTVRPAGGDLRRIGLCVGFLLTIGWAAMLPAALATGEITPHIANLGWYAVYAACLITALPVGRWMADLPASRMRIVIGCGVTIIGAAGLVSGAVHHDVPSLATLAMMLAGAAIIGAQRIPARMFGLVSWLLLALLLMRDLAYDAVIKAPLRARVWQDRDSILHAAAGRGEAVVMVPSLPDDAYPRLTFLTDLTLNPNLGWAREIARWYKVKRVWVDNRAGMSPTLLSTWERSYAAEVLLYEKRVWLPTPTLPLPEAADTKPPPTSDSR